MKHTNIIKRSSALIMALILAVSVCLCISSCEEAEDTSSPKTESDTSETESDISSSVPTGRDIIAKSSAKDAWNDYIYGSSAKTVWADFGEYYHTFAAVGYNEGHFIRSEEEVDEVKNVLKELESHIVKELTEDEVEKIAEQRLAESSYGKYGIDIGLASICMYDGSPKIVYKYTLEPDSLESIHIKINENYFAVSGVAFKLDGDVSEIAEKIKSIRDR